MQTELINLRTAVDSMGLIDIRKLLTANISAGKYELSEKLHKEKLILYQIVEEAAKSLIANKVKRQQARKMSNDGSVGLRSVISSFISDDSRKVTPDASPRSGTLRTAGFSAFSENVQKQMVTKEESPLIKKPETATPFNPFKHPNSLEEHPGDHPTSTFQQFERRMSDH